MRYYLICILCIFLIGCHSTNKKTYHFTGDFLDIQLDDWPEKAKKTLNSVVRVGIQVEDSFYQTGNGVLIDENGFILTLKRTMDRLLRDKEDLLKSKKPFAIYDVSNEKMYRVKAIDMYYQFVLLKIEGKFKYSNLVSKTLNDLEPSEGNKEITLYFVTHDGTATTGSRIYNLEKNKYSGQAGYVSDQYATGWEKMNIKPYLGMEYLFDIDQEYHWRHNMKSEGAPVVNEEGELVGLCYGKYNDELSVLRSDHLYAIKSIILGYKLKKSVGMK